MHGVVVQGPLLRGPRARYKEDRQIGKVKKGDRGFIAVGHRISALYISEVRLTANGCARLSD